VRIVSDLPLTVAVAVWTVVEPVLVGLRLLDVEDEGVLAELGLLDVEYEGELVELPQLLSTRTINNPRERGNARLNKAIGLSSPLLVWNSVRLEAERFSSPSDSGNACAF